MRLNKRGKWDREGKREMPIKGEEGDALTVRYFTDCHTDQTVMFTL